MIHKTTDLHLSLTAKSPQSHGENNMNVASLYQTEKYPPHVFPELFPGPHPIELLGSFGVLVTSGARSCCGLLEDLDEMVPQSQQAWQREGQLLDCRRETQKASGTGVS